MKWPYAESIFPHLAVRPRGTGSVNTGDPISLENYQSCLVIVVSARAAANQDFVVTLQSRPMGGTWVNMPARDWYRKTGGGGGGLDRAAQYALVHEAHPEMEGDHDGIIWTEVVGADLPTDHDQIRVSLGVGANAKDASALYVLMGGRYAVPVTEAPPR